MKITTIYRTKRNGSPVIKIEDNKFLCLDPYTGECYRTCTNFDELDQVPEYELSFKFERLLELSEKRGQDYSLSLMREQKEKNDLLDKLRFCGEVLHLPNIYNYCVNLKEQKEKEVEKLRIKNLKDAAKSLKIPFSQYEYFLRGTNFLQFNTAHSMGCLLKVYIDDLLVKTYDSRKEYAKSSKYKANHGSVEIKFISKEVCKIKNIGGIPTILGKKIDNHYTKCTAFICGGDKYNSFLLRNQMILTGDFHAENLEDAKLHRAKMAFRLIQKRNEGKSESEKLAIANRKFVGYNHSILAGNCQIGTKAFAKKHDLKLDNGYNLGFLISLEPNNQYLKRLI